MDKSKKSAFNQATQILLPAFTLVGFLLTAMKFPGYGLTFNLIAQIFWLYAGWKAYKEAGQIGLFITAVGLTLVLVYGVLNYFVL